MRARFARAWWSIGGLLLSPSAGADTIEERAWTVISQHVNNPFEPNPAAVPTSLAAINLFQLTQNEEANYIYNPGDNQTAAKHKTAVKDLALGGQYPLGGAAVGYHYDRNTRSISAETDQRRNRTIKEEFLTREHKLKFVVDLTADFRAGFGFRYQTVEADLLGAHNLDDRDHTRYTGNRSGYSLGFFYQFKSLGIGLYTSPVLRGKAVIVSEQKIITDPGHDGVDFLLNASDRVKVKVGVNRWTYKRDDRDDEATSPIDQRGIFLRGLEIDQYFRKTQAVYLGGEYLLTPLVALKASVVAQEGVFLFDRSLLPGKDESLETKLDYKAFRAGVSLRSKEFMAELMLSQASRSANDIRVRRGEAGLNTLGSYENKATSVLLSIGAVR